MLILVLAKPPRRELKSMTWESGTDRLLDQTFKLSSMPIGVDDTLCHELPDSTKEGMKSKL
jgi:hypothetical protein